MGPPLVGLVVKGVTHGIGFVQEQRAARKSKPPAPQSLQQLADRSSLPSVEALCSQGDGSSLAPPPYSEVQSHVGRNNSSGGLVLDDDRPASQGTSDPSDRELTTSLDEEYWRLDDIVSETEGNKPKKDVDVVTKRYGLDAQPTIKSLADIVLSKCDSPRYTDRPLSFPIILPQRRPGHSDRGFIRAYSPELADHGISDQAFLSFLKLFQTGSRASPILSVVFLSAHLTGWVPHFAAQVTSVVVQLAVGKAMELQKTHRTNTFLDELNDRLFKPRGLYALIMTYKPEGEEPIDAREMDITTMVSHRTANQSASFKGFRKVYSGETFGELQMLQGAPLVFPNLEGHDTTQGEALGWTKRNKKSLADYMDRRAQAKFAQNNPTSSLNIAGAHPTFASRFSDPTDPIHNGNLLTLVTGGRFIPDDAKSRRKQAARQDRSNSLEVTRNWRQTSRDQGRVRRRQVSSGSESSSSRNSEDQAPRPSTNDNDNNARRGGLLKQGLMKKNILYLMIVNLPTEAELATARQSSAAW